MTTYTVETVMAPIQDEGWAPLRRVIDIVPGTILIEDEGEPMLIIAVDADSQRAAAIYVQGVMSVLGLDVKWGRAYVAEPCDLDYGPADETQQPEPDLAPGWLESADDTRRLRESVYA